MAGPDCTSVQRINPAAASFMLILALLAPFPGSGQATECLYQYLEQPLSALSCDPYAGVATMTVRCRASVPSSEADVAEILWFHNNQRIAGSFPAVIKMDPPEEVMGNNSIITSTLSTDGDSFNDTFQGNYHCQIVVDGDDSTPPSNTLLVEREGVYISDVQCRRFLAVEVNVSCARNATTQSLVTISTMLVDETSATSASSAPATITLTAESGGSPLKVWVYVLVAIAAVFGMIIVVLAILCVGLCLKKNKTEDTNKQKGVEQQFTSNSMMSNGLYQRKDEGGVTSGTHFSSHSQISDNNTLNERDYEVIDMGEDKHDYHHLQRPSPPMPPSGRNFNFTPPMEFHSMSTLTSQIGGGTVASRDTFQHGKMSQNSAFLAKSASEGPEEHVYRELEQTLPSSAGPRFTGPVKDIYRSPTNSDSPDSAQLFNGETLPNMPVDSGVFGYTNESLYSPNFESSLSNVPETGTMFSEPVNPTAFPVHKYEQIPSKPPQYETPVATRTKTVTSPLTLTTSEAGESRPRTNSGARYETELPPIHSEDSHYSKLTRPTGTLATLSTTSPLYSELQSQELSDEIAEASHGNKGVFSQSNAELSKHDFPARKFGGKTDKGFSMPSHLGTSGGVVNRASSVSSATDSLTSHIVLETVNGESTTTDIDQLLFNENSQEMQQQHDSYKSNRSFDTGTRKDSLQQQKRAWSEERRDTFSNGMNRSGFSSSAIDSRSLSGHGRMAAPKMHRELRVNGIDLRLGDYARSKTMV